MSTDTIIERVKEKGAVLIESDGRITCPPPKNRYWQIVSGSFNPLHEAHRALFYGTKYTGGSGAYEISISRYQKPDLSPAELKQRLSQFAWYAPIFVTNAWRYEDKAKALRNLNLQFHIGYDTAVRLLETETFAWLDKTALRFVIYPREQEGKICTMDDLPCPTKPASFKKGWLPAGLEALSSTKIRQGK